MKKLLLTAALSIAATVAITACAVQQPVDINSMSLEKTSPFETPTPKAYGENAGLLALQILGIRYPEIAEKLAAYKKQMAEKIAADDAALQEELKG